VIQSEHRKTPPEFLARFVDELRQSAPHRASLPPEQQALEELFAAMAAYVLSL
jgi:hypothetical protein